jgi:hypothetical protein
MKHAICIVIFTSICAAQSPEAVLRDIRKKAVVEGTLIREADGDIKFRVKDFPQLKLAVDSSQQIKEDIIGLPVTSGVRTVDGGLNVRLDAAELTSVWTFDRERSRLNPKAQAVIEEAFKGFRQLSSNALGKNTGLPSIQPQPPPAMATVADIERFDAEFRTSEDGLIDAYQLTPPSQDAQRKIIVEVFRRNRATRKARYGRYDYYRPLGYGRVLSNSRGSVAIASGSEAVCSGVLVSKDLVLTARHCVANRFAQDLQVWFDYEQDLNDRELMKKVFPVLRKEGEGAPLASGGYLDFALLRLKPDPDGKYAGDIYSPQCLSLQRIQRDDAIYVIGHPLGGHRSVHDNGWVHFPFQVNQHGLTALEMHVRAELLDSPDQPAARLQEFRDSYVRRIDPELGEVWENFSVRWNRQPTLAAEVDTFHGNSGGPAYDRKLHRVVGLLFDGEPDLEKPWKPGWSRHEAILPIEPIVTQINNEKPGWQKAEGVCVYSSHNNLTSADQLELCTKRCLQ